MRNLKLISLVPASKTSSSSRIRAESGMIKMHFAETLSPLLPPKHSTSCIGHETGISEEQKRIFPALGKLEESFIKFLNLSLLVHLLRLVIHSPCYPLKSHLWSLQPTDDVFKFLPEGCFQSESTIEQRSMWTTTRQWLNSTSAE